MSVQAYDGYHDSVMDAPQAGKTVVLVNWLGAITSISLVLGLGFWSYELTMRDITEVPVVRALKGPLRIQPINPGGETAAHQGLAVNSVQSKGGVEQPSDRVVLAPAPVRLSDEDIAQATYRPQHRASELDAQPKNLTDVSALSEGEEALDPIDAAVRAAVAEAESSQAASAIAKLPGVKRSPRPRHRIVVAALGSGTQTSPLLVETPKRAETAVEVDPLTVQPGTRLVQLGAFDDRETATKEWAYILERHGDLIGDRKRLIQEAESGGRSFYRLRMVGFDNLSDSRRLCSALLARGTPCIPVTAR